MKLTKKSKKSKKTIVEKIVRKKVEKKSRLERKAERVTVPPIYTSDEFGTVSYSPVYFRTVPKLRLVPCIY